MYIKKKKAFTLIELIIVIAIIAVLAVIGIPKFSAIRQSARVKVDICNGKILHDNLSFLFTNGKLPDSLANTTIELNPSDHTLPTEILNSIDKVPEGKATSGYFSATIDADKNVTITLGNTPVTVYPNGEGIYKLN